LRRVAFCAIACVGVLAASARGAAAPPPPDRPYQITTRPGEGREEALARWRARLEPFTRQARASYPGAKERYLRGLPRGQTFFVTYVLKDRDGVQEQVFIRVDKIVGGIITGRVGSDLDLVREHRRGDTVSFPESDIVDWTISRPDGSEEGNLIGKYIDSLNQPSAPPPGPPPGARPAPNPTTLKGQPTPEGLRAAVANASHMGRVIYLQYRATTIAADALANDARPHNAVPLGGALAVMEAPRPGEPTSFSVSFFTRDAVPRVAYRVRVPFKTGAAPTVEDLVPPQAASAGLAVLYRAQQTALGGLGQREQLIDSVVVPPSAGEDGIVVYLLASTRSPDIAVLGRHHRVLVSPDGKRVIRDEPLSKSILELRLAGGDMPPGAHSAALAVSHLLTDAPLETHVFASLRYDVLILVSTRLGSWRVDHDKIEFLGASNPVGATSLTPL
jgi:hypothetical protein